MFTVSNPLSRSQLIRRMRFALYEFHGVSWFVPNPFYECMEKHGFIFAVYWLESDKWCSSVSFDNGKTIKFHDCGYDHRLEALAQLGSYLDEFVKASFSADLESGVFRG